MAENLAFFTPLGVLTLLGVLAGLARPRYPVAPVIATLVVLACYGVLLAVAGVWTLECRDCTAWVSDDSARVADMFVAAWYGGVLSFAIIGVTWSAALLSALLALRRRASARSP